MQEQLMLERKTKEELKQIAQGLGIEKISALKKDEIAKLITEKREELAKAEREEKSKEKRKQRPSDAVEVCGVLDVMADGFGFLRFENLRPSEDDVYVSPTQIKRFGLKTGDEITGDSRPSQDEDKYSPLLYVKKINGDSLEVALKRKSFEKLTPIYPKERLVLENTKTDSITSRVIDIFSPIGKGQRGMIVAPPKAGKTTIIKDIAKSISGNYPDVKLIVLLIDERPEEVTDIKRSINGEVVYSTFDQTPENHTKVAEMVLERAMRLVEQKKDVVILLDSITRLARAYNLTVTPTGRTLSGGLDPDALIKPKKFFGAARNIEEGGSLTILATALVETGSRMDDVIFEEFKGTGNMELKLDRSLQERRIFPAIDISKSGTRREEELLSDRECEAVWAIRRDLGKQGVVDSFAGVLGEIRKTKNNEEFCSKVLRNKK
ncbi:MAG: transcription termination factor Rho [Clostridia bacterium]|nr:transcription termination factor Rho [Clostridia bacterium]